MLFYNAVYILFFDFLIENSEQVWTKENYRVESQDKQFSKDKVY